MWALQTRLASRPVAPPDFGQQMEAYINDGMEPSDILERLDPDTAGEDLVTLVTKQHGEILSLGRRLRGERHARKVPK